MSVLSADVIDNLFHSSSISKGIERTMEYMINELAVDSMYIIHYEEGLFDPKIAYEWEAGSHPRKVSLQDGLAVLSESCHFEEDDMYVVEDRNCLEDEERTFYEDVGLATVIEFQMRKHGNIIGYIIMGWDQQREMEDEETEAVHVLLKLLNEQMIKQFYHEMTGGSDGGLFRLANEMTRTLIYVVDEEDKILFANDYAVDQYPNIKPGDLCYRAFRGGTCRCKDCILKDETLKNGEDSLYLSNLEAVFRISVTEVQKQGGRRRYLLTMQRQRDERAAGHRRTLDQRFIFALRSLYKVVIGVEIRKDIFYDLTDAHITNGGSYSLNFVLEWVSILHMDDRQKFVECFDINYLHEAYRNGIQQKELDFRYRTAEGDFHFMNAILLFENTANKNQVVYILFQDVDQARSTQIEEQRQLLDSLMAARSAAELKSEVLANISHEIRTPLGGIISMASVARQVYKDEEKLLECITNIDTYVQHMIQVMDSLLETVNVDQEAIRISKQPFQLDYLFNRIDLAVREKVEKKNIQFYMESQCQYRNLIGDEIRVHQVLCTLIQNAISYIPLSGELRLIAKQVASDGKTVYIRFLLQDTGNGLNDKVKKSIFGFSAPTESGYIDEAHFELSLAARVIQMMGGDIGMHVTEQGTNLYFTLPFGVQERGKMIKRKSAVEIRNFSGKRILLAEDNEMSRDAMRALLEVAGFVVDSVDNGRNAVIRFISKPSFYYDAVLMDVHMPYTDGREATRCIRISGKEDGETVPIIGLMTNTLEEDVQESLQAGMQAHLAKPVDVDKLYKVLGNVISKKEDI
ncbi:MAG: response regulator [Lachnospiraceae bacterium]|nr:response regulator [Lachnospiraceae bacterium]